MTTAGNRPLAPDRLSTALLLAATVVGLGTALAYFAHRESLWEDEIIAATHSLQSLPTFFVQVLRNDIHPFVYFLLVKIWAGVLPGSDRWLLASSLVTLLAATGMLAWVAWRTGGRTAALWAVAMFCALPNYAWAGGNLRMYALVPLLALLVWWAHREHLLRGTRGALLAGAVAQLLLAYTHAIEFYFIGFIVLACAAEAWMDRVRSRLNAWVAWQALLFVAMLPLVGSALVRGTEPLAPSSWWLVLLAPAQLVSGWALANDTSALFAGGLVFLALALLCLAHPLGRLLLLAAVLAPVLGAVVVGIAGKPMFKPPVFTANVVPFLVLGAALGAGRLEALGRRAWLWVGAGATLSLAFAAGSWSSRLLPDENFAPAARFVAGHVAPGDAVLVPRSSVFWGVARYAVGPAWGSPLSTMPPSNAMWQSVEQRLGPDRSRMLGLEPKHNVIDFRGVRFVFDTRWPAGEPPPAHLWVVHRFRYTDQVTLDAPRRLARVTWFGDEISVSELVPDAEGVAMFANPSPP